MAEQQVRFDDGAAYEEMMGKWSRIAGEVFLDWLALPKALRCLDVGCGNGAFTELLIATLRPAEAHGVDPAPAQLAFARTRPGARGRAIPRRRRDGAAVCRKPIRCRD